MARTSVSLTLILILSVLALLPARAVRANTSDVTIGFLPTATRSPEILLRGSAPTGSIVSVSVNGDLTARVHAASSMAIYRVTIPLQPGRNQITARLEGTEVVAAATLYRLAGPTFPDLAGDPLRDDIEILANLGVVSGDPSGQFRPNDPLTRAQLSKLLVLALGIQPAGANAPLPMADAAAVPAWARPYVAAAYSNGLLKGFEDGTFRPNAPLTRAQLVAIAVRAVPAASPVKLPAATPFTDHPAIPDWARSSAERARQLGLVEPLWGDTFRAKESVTRREAAAVFRRLIDLVQP